MKFAKNSKNFKKIVSLRLILKQQLVFFTKSIISEPALLPSAPFTVQGPVVQKTVQMQMRIFQCLWTVYKETISKEMNNDND